MARIRTARLAPLAAAATLAALVPLGAADAAVVYSPYSTSAYGVKARIAQATTSQPRVYVQFRRSAGDEAANTGDRQVRLRYKVGAGATKTTAVDTLAKGGSATYRTTSIACGGSVRITLMARARETSSDAWSAWTERSATLRRSC